MMDGLIVKYAFTYGPLMIFFLAVGWAIKAYAPPLLAAWSNMMRETVAALNSASRALDNSTRAIEGNTVAMAQHHETVMVMNRFWDDMRSRMESLECQRKPRRRAASKSPKRKVTVKIEEKNDQ